MERHFGQRFCLHTARLLRLLPFVLLTITSVERNTAAALNVEDATLPLCSTTLRIPKVAILFIARQGMPLEKLWEAWFYGLEGLVPVQTAHDVVCSHNENTIYSQDGAAAAAPCRQLAQGTILQRQYLFSVYVHSSRQEGWTNFDPSSVFFGTLLPDQHEAVWGDTTPAVRYLLQTALLDPLNANFMLLSDSDVPLYPATLVYQQVVNEEKSRVASCWPYDMVNIKRYTCEMEAEGLGIDKWRKSNLWFTLRRDLAKLAAFEEFVYGIFRRHCTGVGLDEKLGTFRGCLTDEHYYASLFAYYNRAKETDCLGVITHSDFRNSVGGHPKKYIAEDVSLQLVEELRRPIWWLPKASCEASTTREARNAFIPLARLHQGFNHDHCNKLEYRSMISFMELHCQLFARKFDGSTALPLLAIFSNSSNELLRFDVVGQEQAGLVGEGEFLTRVLN